MRLWLVLKWVRFCQWQAERHINAADRWNRRFKDAMVDSIVVRAP